MSQNGHIPVLLNEVMEYLEVNREGLYVDCTFGLGGHSLEIVKRNPKAILIGFDIDEECLLKAKDKFKPYAERVQLYHSDFRYLPDLNFNFSQIKGILLDLGVSSFHLDSPERGFSYNQEGPLDMRLDLRNKTTAAKIVNKYSEKRLAQVFHQYGELRQAKKLAYRLVSLRKSQKIETTTQLRQITEQVCGWKPQKGKTHPAAKVFQSLRIEVNQELKSLSGFLERITRKLSPGAKIIAISFHSLEDRIIKKTFSRLATSKTNPLFLKLITKKPVTPSKEEIEANFRARSAKLRAAERI